LFLAKNVMMNGSIAGSITVKNCCQAGELKNSGTVKPRMVSIEMMLPKNAANALSMLVKLGIEVSYVEIDPQPHVDHDGTDDCAEGEAEEEAH
jgi:hypothetical protein